MTDTIPGDLHGLNTVDKHQMDRRAGAYEYSITASGGGNVHLKIEHYTGDQPGTDIDSIKGHWKTIEERAKVESGHTMTGSFTLPETLDSNGYGRMRVKLSRGIGTKGVDYKFVMNP